MIINSTNLRNLQVAFKAAFQAAFDGGKVSYDKVATIVPSSTAEETYAWLGAVPRIREWIGERVIRNLSTQGYAIRNRSWEMTVEVPRERIDDDQYGVYAPMMAEMGRETKVHPDELVFTLLKAGFSTNCFDGQYFFDTDHPVIGEDGIAQSVSNMQAGTGPAWFLIDASRVIKPLIFQERRKAEFVAKDDPQTSDEVFMRNNFIYGAYARYNVGFGFWQMAIGSKAALTRENLRDARQRMRGFKADGGRPLSLNPTHLVVGPQNENAARDIVLSDRLANGQSNTDFKLVEIIESTWLD